MERSKAAIKDIMRISRGSVCIAPIDSLDMAIMMIGTEMCHFARACFAGRCTSRTLRQAIHSAGVRRERGSNHSSGLECSHRTVERSAKPPEDLVTKSVPLGDR